MLGGIAEPIATEKRELFKELMVELKILERGEAVAKRLQGHDAVAEDTFEIPPKRAVRLIERGVGRTASWTDFEEDTSLSSD